MDKQKILSEIKRMADANGGEPPGVRKFERETGIRQTDMFPQCWLRWGDALLEAGYSANEWGRRTSDGELFEKYVALARKLGHFPIMGELLRERMMDKTFPSENRFGGLAVSNF